MVPDSVCDPHTILLHGVLSNFRSRAMRQLEIIAPRHQLDVLRRSSEASRESAENTRISVPVGIYWRDSLKLAIAASRRLNGWCEFLARLLNQRLVSWQPSLPITFIAARYD